MCKILVAAVAMVVMSQALAGVVVDSSVGKFEVLIGPENPTLEDFSQQPWWNDEELAREFASSVQLSLGWWDPAIFGKGGVSFHVYDPAADPPYRSFQWFEYYSGGSFCCHQVGTRSLPSYSITPLAIARRVPSVDIGFLRETESECTSPNSGSFQATALTYDDPIDPFTTLDWELDGQFVGSVSVGEPLEIDVPLGEHTLKVIGHTINGETDESEASITIVDTTAPSIQAALEPSGKKNQAKVSITATDVCDPNPMFTATAGIEVMDGQLLKIDKKSNELELGSDGLSLTIVATDASGNTTEEQVQLQQ